MALCAERQIDAMIGESSGYPVTDPEVLRAMREHHFCEAAVCAAGFTRSGLTSASLYVLFLFMSIEGDMRERHGRVLAELAEAGMGMVRRLSEAMLATDDLQTQAQVGLAFHRVSRAVRQTIALEFRLTQEPRRPASATVTARPASQPEAGVTPAPPRVRPERTSWSEYESDDSDELLDELDELLDAEDPDLDAVHEAVEACIAGIRDELDAAAPPAMGDMPPSSAARESRLPLPGGRGHRRSWLMGGAVLARPLLPPLPPPPVSRRSSA